MIPIANTLKLYTTRNGSFVGCRKSSNVMVTVFVETACQAAEKDHGQCSRCYSTLRKSRPGHEKVRSRNDTTQMMNNVFKLEFPIETDRVDRGDHKVLPATSHCLDSVSGGARAVLHCPSITHVTSEFGVTEPNAAETLFDDFFRCGIPVPAKMKPGLG